jgi:hypothetical protein
MPPLVFDTVEESERYTDEVAPRLRELQRLVNNAILPAVTKLQGDYTQLMLDVQPAGELEDFADQIAAFIPPEVEIKVAEAFAGLEAVVSKLYEIHAINPALLKLPDLPEE